MEHAKQQRQTKDRQGDKSNGRSEQGQGPAEVAPEDTNSESIAGEEDPGAALDALRPSPPASKPVPGAGDEAQEDDAPA